MIEVADNNAAYYYHRACPERSRGDALGSVIALSDSTGDSVETYEYSVYGEVSVEEGYDHTNPYMFAGRRYDAEIGLYYNRARYYNPYTGRFLQADPIGYGDGMNMYAYCGSNPIGQIDTFGLSATYDTTVYGEGTDGIWGYFKDIDGNVWGLTGIWNEAGLGEDWGIMPWELESYTIDGVVYFVQTDGSPPDSYTPGDPIWDMDNPPLFGGLENQNGIEFPGKPSEPATKPDIECPYTYTWRDALPEVAEAYSQACYGALNAMSGGLFKRECGLPYIVSKRVREWSEDDAFGSGERGWRRAEVPLIIAGGLRLTRLGRMMIKIRYHKTGHGHGPPHGQINWWIPGEKGSGGVWRLYYYYHTINYIKLQLLILEVKTLGSE